MDQETVPLSSLRKGDRVENLIPGSVVTIVGVDLIDDDLAEVFFKDDAGRTGARAVSAVDMVDIRKVTAPHSVPPLDGDQDEFRLAAEALRIKYAALYDPMAAVNSSKVDPLPHQIRAVYEEMLPKIPLRFLLADDPGAGKTIMAGLYLKELMLRSDCERAIIVAPGGLVEQWRDELSQKFDLTFEILSRQMMEDSLGKNVFQGHPYLIVRMDQVSRSQELMEQLADVRWDVAVVDEAHRMSARFSNWAGEVEETKRFKLGRMLSHTASNFLLMTATPHAGKEEDFQLFMSLLDSDRFEGKFRPGVHRTDTSGLMRRMVKEDLLTFEGKPLFPERKAYTVQYELSLAERDLYEQVTEYVRTEMGRAERLMTTGDKKRGNNVGFALTVLQRRLASSPEAILRSLLRRQERLEKRLKELSLGGPSAVAARTEDAARLGEQLPAFSMDDMDAWEEEVSFEERARYEEAIEQVVDLSTASQSIPELRAEIATLEHLVEVAWDVRNRDQDRKWVELREILDQEVLAIRGDDEPRKIIIFTEHKDTLDYLQRKISSQLGRADSVIVIHGGTSREDRMLARERFTHDPNVVVLLATDAAGEGLNLQRAHLMVNYDLPWNPNRIEQRFGRIHRIGQREVCHLWNLVAKDTREGDVFIRLLDKIEQMGIAYRGNLFNVLGEADAFNARSLRDLLLEAIRYGDQPEVKARLGHTIDAAVSDGLTEMVQERALHPEMYSPLDIDEIRENMEKARERRLQPGYIAAFFLPAFQRLGGRIRRRENGRYEVTRVPQKLVDQAKRLNRLAPLPEKFERVAFEQAQVEEDGSVVAALIAPGSPLLSTVIEATISELKDVLSRGTIFIDRRDKQSDQPALMYVVEQQINDGRSPHTTLSRHFDYPLVQQEGGVTVTVAPPYLDFDKPSAEEMSLIEAFTNDPWLGTHSENSIRSWTYRHGVRPRLEEMKLRISVETARTMRQVRERLLAEINHWEREHLRLEDLERAGTLGRLKAETARTRVKQLESRLERRTIELESEGQLVAVPAVIRATALVVPSKLLHPFESKPAATPPTFARETAVVERRAVEAALNAERALGRRPEEMARNNPGYDIRSVDAEGRTFYIEVKGRMDGADTFTITTNEVTFAQTQGERHRLALVKVSPAGPQHDELRYISGAFAHMDPSATTRSYNEVWKDYWGRGTSPQ